METEVKKEVIVKIELLDEQGNGTGNMQEFTQENYKRCSQYTFMPKHKIVEGIETPKEERNAKGKAKV